MWAVTTTAEFDEWFVQLPEDAQVEVIAKVDLLKVLGPRFGRPHADTLNGTRFCCVPGTRAACPRSDSTGSTQNVPIGSMSDT